MNYNCLIIDDEVPLAESTAEYFNLFGVSTAVVSDAESCFHFLAENHADLILLDINLEHSSGFELCKKLRETTNVPIMFISARQSDNDILMALHIGGDDYIRKPYSLNVLLAKVQAILKRYAIQKEEPSQEKTVYHFGKAAVDFAARRVFADRVPIHLRAMEYKLLCYLIKNRGRVIPKEELFDNVWGDNFTGDGTLNVHIRHLREQLEENPKQPAYIQTVWGTGYFFECEEAQTKSAKKQAEDGIQR